MPIKFGWQQQKQNREQSKYQFQAQVIDWKIKPKFKPILICCASSPAQLNKKPARRADDLNEFFCVFLCEVGIIHGLPVLDKHYRTYSGDLFVKFCICHRVNYLS